MKYLSLFSGIGGFELGMPKDWECIGFSEIDKYAIQIYQNHFLQHKNYGNITTIDTALLPDFDLICGGFPCQPFSIAGKRKGFNEARGNLFFEIARIAKAKKPRTILLENVKGLLNHDSGKTFGTILCILDELGYDLQWQVLNSKNFGVPQNRERVFIIGHLRGTNRPKVFPITEFSMVCKNPAVTLTARGYGSQRNGTYVVSHSKIRRLTILELERMQSFPDHWTAGISTTQREKCLGNAVTVNVIKAITSLL